MGMEWLQETEWLEFAYSGEHKCYLTELISSGILCTDLMTRVQGNKLVQRKLASVIRKTESLLYERRLGELGLFA